MLYMQFITVPIAREYRIAEAIYSIATNEFILILFHPSEIYPAVRAKARFLRCYEGTFLAFEATSLNDNFKLAGSAHEALESTIGLAVKEIYKCMYAKNVMTET